MSVMRVKRKDLDDDEFDFHISAPAMKIRRLDATLPSIVEEPVQSDGLFGMEEAAMADVNNEERALVLYKPVNDDLLGSPTSGRVSYTMSSNLISGLKNQYFWPMNPTGAEGAQRPAVNNCLALVPWQAPVCTQADAPPEEDLMDAEGTEVASMEVEESSYGEPVTADVGANNLQHWSQHCMSPQLQPNPSSPIMW